MNVARPAGVGLLFWALIMASLDPAPALAEKLRLEPLTFGDLAGWAQDDHAAAFATFLESCRANTAGTAPLRPAQAPNGDLARVCRSAAFDRTSPAPTRPAHFFEAHFRPMRVVPSKGEGFLTGYYEPEFEGSRSPSPVYRVPLLDRPDDLVTVPQGETLPGLDPSFQAAPPQQWRLRTLSGSRRHRDRSPGNPCKAHRVSARTRRGLHPSRSGLRAHPARGRIGDAGRLCGPQRPSLHVRSASCWCSKARSTSKP